MSDVIATKQNPGSIDMADFCFLIGTLTSGFVKTVGWKLFETPLSLLSSTMLLTLRMITDSNKTSLDETIFPFLLAKTVHIDSGVI